MSCESPHMKLRPRSSFMHKSPDLFIENLLNILHMHFFSKCGDLSLIATTVNIRKDCIEKTKTTEKWI